MKTNRSFLLALSLVITTPLFGTCADAVDYTAPEIGAAYEFAQTVCAGFVQTSFSDGGAESVLQKEATAPFYIEVWQDDVKTASETKGVNESEAPAGWTAADDSDRQEAVDLSAQTANAADDSETREEGHFYKQEIAEIATLFENPLEKHAHQYVVTGPGQVQCTACQESKNVSTFMPDPDAVIFACKAGESFWVPVLVNNTEFVGVTLRVEVSDNVQVTGASTDGTLFAGSAVTVDRNIVLNAGNLKDGNSIRNGRLVYLRLTAREDLSVDTAVQIRLFSDDVVCVLPDNEVKNIEGSCYFGTILYTVQSPLGDVNGDGIIDIEDARILYRYVEKWAPSYYEPYRTQIELNGDVNKDGVIDEKDAELLLCYVNGWEDSFWGDSAVIPDFKK